MLKYAVDACRRFLKKKRRLRPFESVLMRFFSSISLADPGDYPGLFERLNRDLFAGSDQAEIESVLDYLNFQKWIEAKLGAA